MEKVIFFALAVPILGFVFYLGGTAIMKGFKAKVEKKKISCSFFGKSRLTKIAATQTNKIRNWTADLYSNFSKNSALHWYSQDSSTLNNLKMLLTLRR